MTVVLGLLCEGGAILGADSAATSTTASIPLCESAVTKIALLGGGDAALACSGSLDAAQSVADALGRLSVNNSTTEATLAEDIRKQLRSLMRPTIELAAAGRSSWPHPDWLQDMARQTVGSGVYLRALKGQGKAWRPCVVGWEGLQVEYCEASGVYYQSCGSGSLFSHPTMSVLKRRLFSNKLPTIPAGTLAVYYTLREVIESRAGGGVGGPLDLAVLG